MDLITYRRSLHDKLFLSVVMRTCMIPKIWFTLHKCPQKPCNLDFENYAIMHFILELIAMIQLTSVST